MILKASQRAGGQELAAHLLNGDGNEHVTVHEVSGFIALDLPNALKEAYAISLGTKCTQYLFSLSLNPPETESVPVEDFEEAIEETEKRLGLKGQPRAIVFHEKNGRRHCHCVWSRVYFDGNKLKAVNMAHFKTKLNTIAKGLYQKHGWTLPKGFRRDEKAKETNYSRAEWQQAERLKENPELLKQFFGDCWQQSDNKRAFASALQEYGYFLAKGDRRGYVAVDYQGEVYSLSRWLGVKTKALKEKLGDRDALPSADQARAFAQSRMNDGLEARLKQHRRDAKAKRAPLVQELRELVKQQRSEREKLLARQQDRWRQEAKLRFRRFSRGLSAVWDHVTGRHQQISDQNEAETTACHKRDQDEQHQIIQRHLAESRALHRSLNFFKQEQQAEAWRIKREMAGYINTAAEPEPPDNQLGRIAEEIIMLEQKIVSLSGNIEDLQGALDSALLSDDMRAKIKVMIERAKEALWFKKAQENLQFKQKQDAKAEELEHAHKTFYRLMQRHEALKQEYEEHRRKIVHNREFYDRIQNMGYTLNGLPLHPIVMNPPPGPVFDEVRYQKNLRRKSAASLNRAITVRPPKQAITTTGLRENVLMTKEILKRTGTRPPEAPSFTATQRPRSHLNKINLPEKPKR
jgi:hypothetical protein